MSLKELAIVNKKDKHYEFSSNFDGVTHVLRLDYNERNDTWHLTLKNAAQDVLLSNIPLLTNVDGMVERFALNNVMPWGDILVIDTKNNANDPSYDNFGLDVSAFYFSVRD